MSCLDGARLSTHRHELIDPKIAEHGGRLVKTTGDGLLVEFAGPVEALRCAVEIQRSMVDLNAEFPPDKPIEFQIGAISPNVILALISLAFRRVLERAARLFEKYVPPLKTKKVPSRITPYRAFLIG
jgi:class 3 adenylate cyclase